jgi:hypothetical protein
MQAVSERPDPEHWWAIHQRCDPNIDMTNYFIRIDRISTLTEVMEWTCHLNGKRWQSNTDWFRLVKRITANPTNIHTKT